jgi:hypothetical protein
MLWLHEMRGNREQNHYRVYGLFPTKEFPYFRTNWNIVFHHVQGLTNWLLSADI